jgi:3',5'-cyclic AMP phosphodiesterase CpdA
VRLGVLADLHWRRAPGAPVRWHAPYDFAGLAERCAATVARLAAHGCELLVVAGDLTHDGDEASCAAALDCLAQVAPIPVVAVEGNHDVRLDRALHARAQVRRGWRCAETLADDQRVALRAVGLGRDGRWARDRAVRPVAADARATVLVSHFPLVAHADRLAAAGLPSPGELAERALLLELLAATRVPTVVLSGHLHVRDAAAHENVLQLCVPALAERPHEAAVVDLDPRAQTVRCSWIRSDGSAAAAGAEPWLLAPPEARWSYADGAWTRRTVATPDRVLVEV